MICPHCHRDSEGRFCPYDGRTLTAEPRISLIEWSDGPMTGRVIRDRYQMLGVIGKGAMASIYVAEDMTNGEPVAVKIMHTAQGRNRERLFHEVLAASAVGHPNIIRIYDLGEFEDKTPYVVMEYLKGESLGDYIRREGKCEPAKMLPLLHQVASALAAAHALGVVHRDVKPDNIYLLGAIGEGHTARIVDFGLAKSTLRLTAMGTAVGTAEYMAPEQALTDPVDGRTDIYAFGIVLYRAFTGNLPFDSENKVEIMAHQVISAPPPPFPGVPTEEAICEVGQPDPKQIELARLSVVIQGALRKQPHNRYPSMTLLAEDLERLMGRRSGLLEARKLRAIDDVYRPVGAFAQIVISQLYQALHLPVPPGFEPPPLSS